MLRTANRVSHRATESRAPANGTRMLYGTVGNRSDYALRGIGSFYCVWPSLVAVTIVVGGCGDTHRIDDAAPQPGHTSMVDNASVQEQQTSQGSPRAVVKKMYHAAIDADKDRFIECFRSPDVYREFLDEYYGDMVACFKMKEAIRQAYGAEGVSYFEDFTTINAGDIVFRLPPSDKASRWWEDLQCQVDGDEAVCGDPYQRERLTLVREEGVWRIELPRYVTTQQYVSIARKGRIATEKTLPLVGKPGVTIDDIRRKMGELTE